MHFGHRLNGKITGYDPKGRGLFEPTEEHPGNPFVVPFTAKDDDIEATFVTRDRGMKILKLQSVTTPGPDRIAPPCPHAGVCGGCLWQHLAYPAQLEIKRTQINQAFADAGHDERVTEIVPAKETFHYRNRMDYVVGWNGQLGLKEYGSWNRYVDLSTCLLLNPGVDLILGQVREWMQQHDLRPWDAKHYAGDIRYVVVREGKRTEQRLITIVVHAAKRISETARQDLATRLRESCTTLLIGEQPKITDISLAETFETIFGNPWLEEVVNDIRYRIHPNSFFQTNTTMAEQLQNRVSEALKNAGDVTTVLDLYCGLGFFTLALAKQHPEWKLHGVEIDEPAIQLAKENAVLNKLADRVDFTAAKSEDLTWKEINADAIILDPPRSGLHPRVLDTLLEIQPQTLIYISCNYHRLVEELKRFKAAYDLVDLKALDLFPHTPHVEVVCTLKKKS